MTQQILVIDDKKNFPAATKIARSYDKGIKALSAQAWDQLYLDSDLGGSFDSENGISVLAWLVSNPQHCPPVIRVVSAFADANRSMARFIQEHLPKVQVITRYDD